MSREMSSLPSPNPPIRRGTRLRWVLTLIASLVLVGGIANFASFVIESSQLGGSASSGHESDGRYFVSQGGRTKEVDEPTWRHNQAHGVSIWLTHPLALLAAGYLGFQFMFPALLRRGRTESASSAWPEVVDSSRPLAAGRCGGKLGGLSLSVPLVRVAVYESGLWVKPLWMDAVSFTASEIERVDAQTSFPLGTLVIAHRSPRIASPIRLFGASDKIEAVLRRIRKSR